MSLIRDWREVSKQLFILSVHAAQTSSSILWPAERRLFDAKVTGRSVFSCVVLHKHTTVWYPAFCARKQFSFAWEIPQRKQLGASERGRPANQRIEDVPPHSIFPPFPEWMKQHKPLWHLRKLIFAKGSDHDAILWCCHHQLQQRDNDLQESHT